MDNGSTASAARDPDLALSGCADASAGATPHQSSQLEPACWWCGSAMEDGAVFLSFRRRGQLCCHECAATLDVPGLYLG